jgi:hypothetical protein
MERITEKQLAAMAEWLTDALRDGGQITGRQYVETFTPHTFRIWAIYDMNENGYGRHIVRTFDGVGGTRRELWNSGRAMLWAVRGY